MHKPLISKIRCLSPNRRSTAIRNYNHLYYIATREGVDLRPLEQELKSFQNDMSSTSDNPAYTKYISQRPRSSGLFGNIDTNNVNALCNYMKKISNSRCVFRGIVSLCQEDAEELDFTNKENWSKFLQENLPDIGETFGISNNDLAWVAAFHNEQGHPHVHYMLWSEAKEQHIKPFISIPQQHHCRELLSHKMFDKEHEHYKYLRTNFRDLLVQGTRKNIQQEVSELKQEVLGVPEYRTLSRINKQLLDDARIELLKLVELIPERGRIKSYALMPENIKNEINSVAKLFLTKYELQDEYKKFIKSHEHLTQTWTPTKAEKEISARKAKGDIDNRLGNVILKAVKELRQNKDLYSSVIDLNIALDKKEYEDMTEPLESFSAVDSDTNTYQLESESADPSIISEPITGELISSYYIKWDKGYKSATAELYSDDPDFDKVVKLLDTEHQKGNVLATYELGKIYERNLANANPELAQSYYEKALAGFHVIYAQEHKSYPAYRLGKMYEYGQGTEKNIETAKYWYENAKDNVYAQYSLAKILMSEAKATDDFSNKKRIVDLLKSSSVKNNYAAYELGRIYHDGLFDEQDTAISQKFYKQAFNGFSEMLSKSQKNDDLLYRLGKMHQLGLGTDIDIEKATNLYEKAAVLKNTNALYSLSKIYIKSNDDKLLDKAIKILEELNQLTPENHLVSYSLGAAYADLQSKHYDIYKAIKYLEQASELGNNFAMFKLGTIYSASSDKYEEVPSNIPLAISFFEKSASVGNHLAVYSLGKLFSDPDLGYYDIHKAIGYLERASCLGNDFAMLKLGNIYSSSADNYPEVPTNISRAISYLEKASAQENNQAMYSLGKILTDLDSAHCDIQKGIEFLTQSANLGNDFAMLKLVL